MKKLYQQLEELQADVAISRSARHHCLLAHVCIMFTFVMHACIMHQLARPDQQKCMLQLCSACTRTDVALNNLVVRARTLT